MVHPRLARFIIKRAAREGAVRVLEEVDARERFRRRLKEATGTDLLAELEAAESGNIIPSGRIGPFSTF